MPTTFNVIFLGTVADIDTVEGNTVAENASALVGQTFGGYGNALSGNIQTFSPGPGRSTFSKDGNTYYDQDDRAFETFRINGGPLQGFDSSVVYNATITYLGGTTATITAVIFQDSAGRLYLAPEFAANADQAALEAGPILSLTLDSLVGNSFLGMTADRQAWTAVACFAAGTRIATDRGERRVETLAPDDLVLTQDAGLQPVRWIGKAASAGQGKAAPIHIAAGSLGQGLPHRDLVVSPQHRILLRSRIAERMFGTSEVLVPARKLLSLPGIAQIPAGPEGVTYVHFMCDVHQIVYAEGAPTETLLPGPMGLASIGREAAEELRTLFPELETMGNAPARPIPPGRLQRTLVGRHDKNAKPLLMA